MKLLKTASFALLSLLLFNQCEQDEEVIQQSTQTEIPDKIIETLDLLGVNTEDFPVVKKEDGYVVEGDIFIDDEFLKNFDTSSSSQRQARSQFVLSCGEARDITVRSSIPSINDQIRAAIRDWNSVSRSFLRFRFVTGDNADITIRREAGNLGQGRFPTRNNRPGNRVLFDPSLYNSIRNVERRNRIIRFVIRHELGHNIGLDHTNQVLFAFISGTPRVDANSVMNAQSLPVNSFQQNNLTRGDRQAIFQLYGSGNSNRACLSPD